MSEQNAAIDSALSEMDVTMTHDRVTARPDSATDWDKDAFHYLCTIKRGKQSFTVAYSMGSAHVEKIPFKELSYNARSQMQHYGGAQKVYHEIGAGTLKPKLVRHAEMQKLIYRPAAPQLRDVLYSLITDAGAVDYTSFEEWAQDFGYETDSRQAERTFNACRDNGRKVRAMFPTADYERLLVLYQDY